MALNLTPMYRKAEEVFRAAKTTPEKIAALEEMYALLPKHKASEKMQAELKQRLSKLRATPEPAKTHGTVDLWHIERHGAGQFVLLGMPNCGKSALVGALTKARVTVAAYPFSTHAPVPGMMPYEDIQIQLVDMPPLTPEGLPPGMLGAIKAAQGILVCIALSADVLEQVDACFGTLEQRGVVPRGRPVPEGGAAMLMVLVGTKLDLPGAAESFEVLKELHADLAPMLAVSAEAGQNLGELPRQCFKLLDIVRIYSKEPGKPIDREKPFVLPRGSTVLDLAALIHKDLAQNLKRARIWGTNVYDGQPAPREHVLADRDVIELHV